jgi:hypothetical protein
VPFPAPSLETSGKVFDEASNTTAEGGRAPHSRIRNPNSALEMGGRVASRKAGRKGTHFLNSFWDSKQAAVLVLVY